MIEAAGCAAFAIHTQNPTNHLAFLVSFMATNLGPCFLAMSALSYFKGHISAVMSLNEARPRSKILTTSSLFNVLQAITMVTVTFSIYHIGSYLSSRPVEGANGALARLAHLEQGSRLLVASHGLQLLFFSFLTAFTAYWTAKIYDFDVIGHVTDRKNHRHVLAAVSTVSFLCMFRSALKAVEYISVDSTTVQLVASRADFWFYDALPTLMALVILCSAFPRIDVTIREPPPYMYTQLPEIKVVFVDEEMPLSHTKS
ncbi:MAG: hypothetical protein M1828_004541 [Chrysothrix sp. TS-e1954]|nr:MAG: hypothetical protein M1828_004541 [Chrysothrix sp. TS-e1954]